MTISQNGINYICQSFGNTSFCCVRTGLSWYYTVGGVDYPETGGTAQIVSRLSLGLIDSLTMTNPARGTFTQTQLNNANGSAVSLSDAQTITQHDQPPNQWCAGASRVDHKTDTKTVTITVTLHGSCDVLNIVVPSNVEINQPFDIAYDCINNGATDTCYGQALINDIVISGTRWDETINQSTTKNCTAHIPGVTADTVIAFDVGYTSL